MASLAVRSGTGAEATQDAAKDGSTNPRGIPYAPFVDQVEDYITSRSDVESTLKSFSEMISKYQFMEVNTQRRQAGLREKIPDIKKTLDTVRFLATRQKKTSGDDEEDGLGSDGDEEEKEGGNDLEAHFELNDTLYAKARIPPTDEVYLWLGANVMLSYPIAEAEALLVEKLSVARTQLGNSEEDLDFLREQITTLEVATARVYNWDVAQRRKERGGK